MSKRFGYTIFLFCFIVMSYRTALADGFSGRVFDDTGAPLAGAFVEIAGSRVVVVTDAEGRFEFILPDRHSVRITVSCIGYESVSNIIRADNNVIRMSPEHAEIREVVVTATRTPKTLKDVPVVTRLITSDEIKKTDAANIQDLLTEELPGLEFGYAMSQETSLNMNGFGGSAILFLVDGERLAGETIDNVDYNRLTLDRVGQIEIVKGASSALYGANAVGGVVNLITRESDAPWAVSVNSRYRAAGNEWRSGGNVCLSNDKWNSNTFVQYAAVETIRLTDLFDTESKYHEIFGGRSLNIGERFTYRVGDDWRVTARGGYFSRVSNRNNYDDSYHDYNCGLKGLWQIDPTQSLELSYSYDQYDKARYVNELLTHDHDYSNRQHIIRGFYTKVWGVNGLTAGADYMHDYLKSYQFVNNGAHSQMIFDAFVQFDYNPLTWINVIASLRNDYFSESDNNALTARLAAMFKLKPLSVRASYAGGFRAPTLKEMYMCFDMAGIQMIYGNPNLKPERSHNLNVAVERAGRLRSNFFAGSYDLTLSGFHNYYNSRITTMDFPGDATREAGAMYTNEAGVVVVGIDVNVRYRSSIGLGISVGYNYMHTFGGTIDSQFSQPRPHSAVWRIDYEKCFCRDYKIYASLSGRYLSKPVSRYETDGAYSLWKLTLQQCVCKGIKVSFVIDNLLNYKPKIYYWNSVPTIGRTWSIGISLDINDLC